jgi:hypothetical protein
MPEVQSKLSPSNEKRRQASLRLGLMPPNYAGEKNPMFGKRGPLSPNFKGYVYCQDCGKRLARRCAKKCMRCNKLKVTTPLYCQIRKIMEYRQWRSDIFTRDNFTCQSCFVRGGRLQAHHIKPFYQILEENKIVSLKQAIECVELWNLNNGLTLCLSCHEKTASYMDKFLKKEN